MSGTVQYKEKPIYVSKISLIAFCFGLGSMAALLIVIIVSFNFEVIGLVTLFRSIILPLSVVAIIAGAIARSRISAEYLKEKRKATLGMVFGIITLSLVLLVMLSVFLIFIPLLYI